MTRRFVDISIFLENDVVSDPEPYRPRIEYIDHDRSVPDIAGFFPGLAKEDLPDGEAWAIERIELITHNGTHLDAPYHFARTMNKGERAITIDEVPLEWCFQPGVKLDFRHLPDGYVVTASDVEAELARIGEDFTGKLALFEKQIHELAGRPFNVGSTKQLGEILFDEMKLPGGKRSKLTGAWGTDASVLEDLAARQVPLARRV